MDYLIVPLLASGIVEFPTNAPPAGALNWFPFIGHFVYWLVGAMYGGGAVAYGVAIILFTLVLKLMLLPMDVANKYFTKRNAGFMAKMKPEDQEIREKFAGDPIKMNQARREMYNRHGYKMGGFCLFMFINLFITMAIFMSVFSTLRYIADYNERLLINDLQATYQDFESRGEDRSLTNPEWVTAVNNAYANRNVGFLWIQNIWREDVPWGSHRSWLASRYNNHADRITVTDQMYADINQWRYDNTTYENPLPPIARNDMPNFLFNQQFDALYLALENDPQERNWDRSWNGLLILIVLAGVTSWSTAYVTSKMMMAKKRDEPKKEKEAGYSMRNVRDQQEMKMPQVDPVMMGRIMKIVLPAIMVYFTMISTAALAIYIITSSLISTLVLIGLAKPIDKLLAWQEKRSVEKGKTAPEIEPDAINPHAKYFKNKRRKQ